MPDISKAHQAHLEVLASGEVVERDVLNIVERIHAYDPNLRVKYLDPGVVGDLLDAPYVITEMCPDGIERIVTSVWKLDETVYDSVVMADSIRQGQMRDKLAEIDKKNALVKAAAEKAIQDENDALKEMVTDVVKSPKDTYTATNPLSGETHKFTATPT